LSQKIDAVDCFNGYVVVYGRKDGFQSVQVLDVQRANPDAKVEKGESMLHSFVIHFPEKMYECEPSRNREYKSAFVRLAYSSLITPLSIFDFNFETKELTRRKETEVPGYDRSLYACEALSTVADDGVSVPMSMVYRKDKKREENNFVLLTAYGSYGISYDPHFDLKRLSLLDRGLVFIIAHIRGGGEMGRHWYENGKFLFKKNTFTDFISCARHLVDTRLTQPQRLAITGGSAGGLLMGAVLNMRPDLFKTCYTRVPFVDVLVTMSDPNIPLTVLEYEEWGNPADEKFYNYILSYSPMENVKRQEYPSLLVTTGLNDSRVAYWEPMKWVARLRQFKTDSNVVLLRCQMTQGHGGSSGRYAELEEQAFNYGFVLDQLGFHQ